MIISPFLDVTTHNFEVYVTSDLWSPATGSANFTWYDWSGNRLNISVPTFAPVTVGALNTTRVLQTNTYDVLSGYDPANVILVMDVSVKGQMPNSNTTQTFTHTNWFHAVPLSQARLVDPGLSVSYSKETSKFTVKASKGVAAWVWLDYPAGAVLNFDSNTFWLLPGQEKEVGFMVKNDTTGGKWVSGVTIRSLWDNTVP